MDPVALAREMYDVYGASAGWKNYAGLPMPTWETLTDAIRTHWTASARHAIERVGALRPGSNQRFPPVERDIDIDDGT